MFRFMLGKGFSSFSFLLANFDNYVFFSLFNFLLYQYCSSYENNNGIFLTFKQPYIQSKWLKGFIKIPFELKQQTLLQFLTSLCVRYMVGISFYFYLLLNFYDKLTIRCRCS